MSCPLLLRQPQAQAQAHCGSLHALANQKHQFPAGCGWEGRVLSYVPRAWWQSMRGLCVLLSVTETRVPGRALRAPGFCVWSPASGFTEEVFTQ